MSRLPQPLRRGLRGSRRGLGGRLRRELGERGARRLEVRVDRERALEVLARERGPAAQRLDPAEARPGEHVTGVGGGELRGGRGGGGGGARRAGGGGGGRPVGGGGGGGARAGGGGAGGRAGRAAPRSGRGSPRRARHGGWRRRAARRAPPPRRGGPAR